MPVKRQQDLWPSLPSEGPGCSGSLCGCWCYMARTGTQTKFWPVRRIYLWGWRIGKWVWKWCLWWGSGCRRPATGQGFGDLKHQNLILGRRPHINSSENLSWSWSHVGSFCTIKGRLGSLTQKVKFYWFSGGPGLFIFSFLFFHLLGIFDFHIFQEYLTFIFFRGVGQPPTCFLLSNLPNAYSNIQEFARVIWPKTASHRPIIQKHTPTSCGIDVYTP